MYFAELKSEQLLEISGGCGFCTVGAVLGSACTVAGIVYGFTTAGPVLIVGAIVGASIGYLMTK